MPEAEDSRQQTADRRGIIDFGAKSICSRKQLDLLFWINLLAEVRWIINYTKSLGLRICQDQTLETAADECLCSRCNFCC